MNIDIQLALATLALLAALIAWVVAALRFAVRMDRRRPPTPPRGGIASQVIVGEQLPAALLPKTLGQELKGWPKKVAIMVMRGTCEPCDELAPEVVAAARGYREFFFYIDGWADRRHQGQNPMRNLTTLQSGAAARELGISVSPSLVVAIDGVIRSVALVNAGGQIEAALRAASRQAGGGR